MKHLLAAAIAALVLAAPAQAVAPNADITWPLAHGCAGQDVTATGYAEAPGATSFQWSLQARQAFDGDTWQQVAGGTNQIHNGVLGTFSTPAFSALDFRLAVIADGVQKIDEHVLDVARDGVTPGPPTNLTVRAVSQDQAYLDWRVGGGGPSCAGSRLDTTLHDPPGSLNETTIGGGTGLLIGGLCCATHRVSGFTRDGAGNRSSDSSAVQVTPRGDSRTVLAGQVTDSSGRPLFGVNVRAVGPEAFSTMTNADGWYNAPLRQGTYAVTFGPGCGLAFYCRSVSTATDTIPVSGGRDVKLYGRVLATP